MTVNHSLTEMNNLANERLRATLVVKLTDADRALIARENLAEIIGDLGDTDRRSTLAAIVTYGAENPSDLITASYDAPNGNTWTRVFDPSGANGGWHVLNAAGEFLDFIAAS